MENKTQFKIGDKVRVSYAKKTWTTTIISLDTCYPNTVLIKDDLVLLSYIDNEEDEGIYLVEYLELIEDTDKDEKKPNNNQAAFSSKFDQWLDKIFDFIGF